jgi:2-polyprenyl-3-methyl-5-hydroxy-6-metoxy-1,4-benzoquinol methylase
MAPSAPAISAAIASVQARVGRAARHGGRWLAGYAKVKVGSDWIYAQLCERIRPGARVLDLGSGVGLLGLVLEERRLGYGTYGIEWDERKVAFAQRLLRPESPCRVQQGDLLRDPWPRTDVIVLVDVLHYFPVPTQKVLLQRIADHLEPGGALFLRVMNQSARGWARLTRLLEWGAVLLRWNRATAVHWRNLQEIQDDLVRFGLEPTLCLSKSHFLNGNCLIAASKPESGPSQSPPLLGT